MAKQFVLNLNQNDWSLLDEIAKSKGYNNFREMVPDALEKLTKNKCFEKIWESRCDDQRSKNNFTIPENLQDFYINLSCHDSTSVSLSIFRHVIIPLIIEDQNQPGKTS